MAKELIFATPSSSVASRTGPDNRSEPTPAHIYLIGVTPVRYPQPGQLVEQASELRLAPDVGRALLGREFRLLVVVPATLVQLRHVEVAISRVVNRAHRAVQLIPFVFALGAVSMLDNEPPRLNLVVGGRLAEARWALVHGSHNREVAAAAGSGSV